MGQWEDLKFKDISLLGVDMGNIIDIDMHYVGIYRSGTLARRVYSILSVDLVLYSRVYFVGKLLGYN